MRVVTPIGCKDKYMFEKNKRSQAGVRHVANDIDGRRRI